MTMKDWEIEYLGRSYARIGYYKEALIKWGFTNKERILDAGCGFGAWTHVLARKEMNNKKVHGLEPNLDWFNIARSIVEDNNFNVILYLNSIEDQILEDEQYDAILCYHTLYYVHDWKKALETLAKTMSPGGILYVNIATKACFMQMATSKDEEQRRQAKGALYNYSCKKRGEEYRTEDGIPIDQHEFEQELRNVGLKITGCTPDEVANHIGIIGYLCQK
jgi:ubiquinone/menaquinone biosynthesis C-methylase UbiE